MKLTPLDIHHKEFRHALRGYNEEEVDQFLDQVADEFERLFKENIDLSEKLDVIQGKINEFEMQRQTINNTLMTAQRSSDDIIARAQAEADSITAHANTRAKEIVNDALAKKQQVRGELLRIKQAEEEFRERYRSMLENNLKSIAVVSTSDDVSALLGETEDAVEASPFDNGSFAPAAPAPAPVVAPAPVAFVEPEPEIDLDSFLPPEPSPAQDEFLLPVPPRAEPEPVEPAPVEEVAQQTFTPISIDDLPNPSEFDDSVMKPVVAPTQPMPANDPAPSGLISAVNLGELEAPDIPDDFDLVEPSEFALPRFDALGEREDDLDIEEID